MDLHVIQLAAGTISTLLFISANVPMRPGDILIVPESYF